MEKNTGIKNAMTTARKRCESGIYPIIIRGVNRQDVFYDDEDFKRFLNIMEQMKSQKEYLVFGYCLMGNHVHLLIQERIDFISRLMSRIGTSYAWWYNRKYERSGHLFQGRYASECVENETYLRTVFRYIHNNPVKAGLVKDPEEYRWSSIHAYYGTTELPPGLTEPDFILDIIDPNRAKALQSLREFMKCENEDECLDDTVKKRKSDGEVKNEIEALMNGEQIGKFKGIEKGQRREVLQKIKASDGVSQRQIARVIGLSPNIIFKA